jgi:endonuclease III-like uncharacterized protein
MSSSILTQNTNEKHLPKKLFNPKTALNQLFKKCIYFLFKKLQKKTITENIKHRKTLFLKI